MDKLAAFKYSPVTAKFGARKSHPLSKPAKTTGFASLQTKAPGISTKVIVNEAAAGSIVNEAPSKPSSKSSVANPNVLKIWHWNVNGLKLVLKRNTLQKFLQAYSPAVLCLNETKLSQSDLRSVKKQLAPYFSHMHFVCATNRKNYGGVAILYNQALVQHHFEHLSDLEEEENKTDDKEDQEEEKDGDADKTVITGLSQSEEDEDLDIEGRLIAKVFPSFVLVSVYTPHSGVGDLKRLEYRVERWDRAFEVYINRLKTQTKKPVIVCGDLNIIRHDQDIYNPKSKVGRPGTTELERNSFE